MGVVGGFARWNNAEVHAWKFFLIDFRVFRLIGRITIAFDSVNIQCMLNRRIVNEECLTMRI